MTNLTRLYALGLALSLIYVPQSLPQTQPARLTIDRIMDGPDFSGTQPSEVRWSVDGKSLYFRWKKASEKKEGLYVVPADGGEPRRLSNNKEQLTPPFNNIENADRTRKLFVEDGDIFLL